MVGKVLYELHVFRGLCHNSETPPFKMDVRIKSPTIELIVLVNMAPDPCSRSRVVYKINAVSSSA